MGAARHVPRLRGQSGVALHDRSGRGVPHAHRLGRWSAHGGRLRALQRDQGGLYQAGRFEAITHGEEGIGVSVLCPQGVNTAMAPQQLGDGGTDGIKEPEEVAEAVLDAIRTGRFFVLPHPEVGDYVIRKATDPERWLRGMRRLRARSQQ